MRHLVGCKKREIGIKGKKHDEAAGLEGVQRSNDSKQQGEGATEHIGVDPKQEIPVFQFHHHIHCDGCTDKSQR